MGIEDNKWRRGRYWKEDPLSGSISRENMPGNLEKI